MFVKGWQADKLMSTFLKSLFQPMFDSWKDPRSLVSSHTNKEQKRLKKQEITLIIVKGDRWETAKKEKKQKETAKEREGVPVTKSEISFGVVPV